MKMRFLTLWLNLLGNLSVFHLFGFFIQGPFAGPDLRGPIERVNVIYRRDFLWRQMLSKLGR
jgi:hypothetical protein